MSDNGFPAVGFIGAGSMGGPMVERMLAAGVPVHLYARRPEVRSRFAELGARIGTSVGEVAAAAPILMLCPFSDDQLRLILDGENPGSGVLEHLPAGAIVVQHATVPVDSARTWASAVADRGSVLLDAPVSGTSDDIRAGRLTVLLGGPDQAAEAVGPVLGTYASTLVRTGTAGSASLVKLINNLTFAAHVQVAVAAAQLGERAGVAMDDLLAALTVCSADSSALRHLRAVGAVGPFVERAGPYLKKDVAVVEQVAAALGLDTGFLGRIVHEGPAPLTT